MKSSINYSFNVSNEIWHDIQKWKHHKNLRMKNADSEPFMTMREREQLLDKLIDIVLND